MRENIERMCDTVEAIIGSSTKTSFKVSGKMTRSMDMASSSIQMETITRVIGATIRRMATVKRNIGTDQSIQETLRMATDMVLVS